MEKFSYNDWKNEKLFEYYRKLFFLLSTVEILCSAYRAAIKNYGSNAGSKFPFKSSIILIPLEKILDTFNNSSTNPPLKIH
jgi:hypothetical protein